MLLTLRSEHNRLSTICTKQDDHMELIWQRIKNLERDTISKQTHANKLAALEKKLRDKQAASNAKIEALKGQL